MSLLRIASIVEGHGEVEAVPILIRRHADWVGWQGTVEVKHPIREPASKMIQERELERWIDLAIRKLRGPGGIFILLDGHGRCPAALGPELLRRVRRFSPGVPAAVVVAHHEYEAWFLAAAESLAGKRSLPAGFPPPQRAPESIQNCKGWLTDQMPPGSTYRELEHQPAFTAAFDFTLAKNASPSFDKCHRELLNLLRQVADITPGFLRPSQ